MDLVWIAAVAAMWASMAAGVAGLHALDAPEGERP